MNTCFVCGKEGHKASKCKSLGVPPDGFYTGGGGDGGHDHDEEDSLLSSALKLYKQACSQDDEILSKPRELMGLFRAFPSRLSSAVAAKA
jgi:hypothetical protein